MQFLPLRQDAVNKSNPNWRMQKQYPNPPSLKLRRDKLEDVKQKDTKGGGVYLRRGILIRVTRLAAHVKNA
jgi:hypothetical protein